jgi:DNA-directed RNA polymerase subunit beta'
MGRLIPAGTGYKFYRNVELREDKVAEIEGEAETPVQRSD